MDDDRINVHRNHVGIIVWSDVLMLFFLQDMASFKIATLQKTREDSVPYSELEAANKQYQELTEKYRDLLEKSNSMVANNEHSATLEVSE